MTAAIACLLAAGCAADAERPSRGVDPPAGAAVPLVVTREDASRVVVTRRDPSLPGGCRPREVALRIAAFLDAFNRGDPAAVDFIAPSGGWYSVSDGRRRHFVAYSRRDLPAYFARRHRQGERMQLEEVDVSFGNGLGHIAYLIDRRADDLRRIGITGTSSRPPCRPLSARGAGARPPAAG